MRRVGDEVLEAVGALRSVIGWPASVSEREKGEKMKLFKEHLTKAIQYFMLFVLDWRKKNESGEL